MSVVLPGGLRGALPGCQEALAVLRTMVYDEDP
jgi:hypothetical protein